jgi:hypothetical protein
MVAFSTSHRFSKELFMPMWDDVVVGAGNDANGSVKLCDIGEHVTVSVNAVSYWINNAYLGGGMTVFKSAPEGAKLKELLDTPAPDEVILTWLENTFLDNVENDRLKRIVQSAIRRAEREARRKKAKDIKKAFGRAFAKIEEY